MAPTAAGSGLGGPFGRLWAATAAANLADGVLVAAAPLLAAALTRDPVLVAGAFVAQKIPWFLFTLISGVLVDRLSHRVLLVAANLLRSLALIGLAAGIALGLESLALLYGVMFVLGTAETVIDTAALAVLPTLVDRNRLEDANGRIYSTQSVMNDMVGPAVGAALFAVTALGAFALGSAAFAAAGLLFLLLPPPRTKTGSTGRGGAPGVLADIGEGLRWFVGDRIVLTAAVMAAISNVFSSAMAAVLVLYASDQLGIGTAAYGLLITAEALGGVLAGLSAGAAVRTLGAGPTIVASILLPAVGYLVLAITSHPVVAGVALALQAAASTFGNVVVITLRQTAVPAALLGRVTSAYRLVALGAVPVGGLLGGVLVSSLGLRAPFLAGAVAMVLLTVAIAPILTTQSIQDAQRSSDLASTRESS